MGFYPTPVTQTAKIISRLRFAGPTALFDPCCGTGEALAQITRQAPDGSISYGIELDKMRAHEAENVLDHILSGGYEYARLDAAAFPILFLNPPYDNQAGMNSELTRKELIFLRDLSKYVAPNGVLVFIVPRYTLTKMMVNALENRYTNLAIYRFDEDEYQAFQQVVVLGTRRTQSLNSKESLTEVKREARNELLEVGKNPDAPIPLLDEADERFWTVPAFPMDQPIQFRGYIRDETELAKDLAESDAFAVATNLLINSALVEAKLRRPLLPFRRTHLATLIASGALNGAIGVGEDRHVVIGVSRKKVTRETILNEDGDGSKIIDTESYVTMVRTIQPDGTIIDLQ